MKYYLLERSLKRKDVGIAFGQTGYLLGLDSVPNIPRVNQLVSLPNWHGNLKNDKFPDFEPRIKFELSEKGKLADLVDIPDVTADGMLVSPKFRDLLERFNLMEHRFYEGVVMAGVFYREYFWFHPVLDFLEWLDLYKSEIYVTDENEETHLVNNLLYNKYKWCYMRIEKMVFKESFPKNDLFFIPNINYYNSYFISEPLMKAIKKEKITGIEIKEQDVFGDL